ncbi:MAG: glycosyltransferase family 39 protein [Candidatus Kerfeldbacteria bacterium]|nr:glycosyltransferase family 39 protein [Candidatus Kerfeldbacteria bacterium]
MNLNWFHRQQKAIITVCLGTVLLTGTCLQCIGAWQDSQTSDEAVHLSAGYSYLRTGDFRLNPEHPPLIKVLAAAPLLFVHGLQLRLSGPEWSWRSLNEWTFGANFLYDNPIPARLLLFLARLPMIAIWLTLGLLLWHWARKRWGDTAGLFGLTFFVFDPNFLGHGHLVTTDVGVSLGIFATVWAAGRYFEQPRASTLIILSIIFALSQITKFSALILWLIVPLLGLVRLAYRRPPWPARHFFSLLLSLLITTGPIIWAAYGLQTKKTVDDPRFRQLWQARQLLLPRDLSMQPTLIRYLVSWTDPHQPIGQLFQRVEHWSIPAYSYWAGLFSLLSHDFWGHPAYLLGQTSGIGWWYYFPVTFLVKTPLVTLLALCLSAIIGLGSFLQAWARRHRPHIPFQAFLLGLPPLLYFGWSLASHINIGLRHIFPIYPFLYLGIARLVSIRPTRWLRWWYSLLLVLALGIGATALASWPNTIGYFNVAAGGTKGGARYLLDSNLDWDQDFWRLRSWLDQQHFTLVHIALFGPIPRQNFFPEALPVPRDSLTGARVKPRDIIIVSANLLYNPDEGLQWLQAYPPRWHIGSSIYAYDFR